MREMHRILSVKEVINLTDQEIWTYGTSGELIKIDGHSPHKTLDPSVYYIVSAEIEDEVLAKSNLDKSHFVEAQYIGRGRKNTPIYHLTNSAGTKIVPITEQIYAVMNKKFGFLIRPA